MSAPKAASPAHRDGGGRAQGNVGFGRLDDPRDSERNARRQSLARHIHACGGRPVLVAQPATERDEAISTRALAPRATGWHGMTAPASPPAAVDLLAQAIEHVRPHLDRAISTKERVCNLWAAVVAARDLGASDVIYDEFLRLGYDTGLATDLGRHADEDLRHVIRWALLDRNPFQ
jgi:hypothetical protein